VEEPLKPSRSRPVFIGLACLAAVAVLAAVLLVDRTATEPEPPLTRAELDDALGSAFATTTPPPPLAAAVYNAAVPSLVFIQTEGGDDGGANLGVGSGVVVNADGLILTAHHVVEGASRIMVTFSDGSSSEARIDSAEPERDIATLIASQNPSIIVPATLGGGVSIGQDVYALGNPLGLAGSITEGVVSGLDRSLPLEDGSGSLEGLIQMDAAVNPGSSGGPLLDRGARVVGIVTALVNPDGEDSFTGIGFAVPIQDAAGGGAGAPPQ
jgi:S1-C subfamily serine protease